MTSGNIEVFVTSLKRVKIHVGFARWGHTGSGELYNGDTFILGQERAGTEQVEILTLTAYSGTITWN